MFKGQVVYYCSSLITVYRLNAETIAVTNTMFWSLCTLALSKVSTNLDSLQGTFVYVYFNSPAKPSQDSRFCLVHLVA